MAGTGVAGAPPYSNNTITGKSDHLYLNVDTDTKQVRINHRNFTATSGDFYGFQTKPAVSVQGTAVCHGAWICPRFLDGIGGNSLIGVLAEPILKGTSGTLTGDVRAVQAQITDENVAGRTVDGTVSGIWFWQQLAGHTFTGGVYPIHVITHGGGTAWSGLAKLPDDDTVSAKISTGSTQTNDCVGWIKFKIGTQVGYVNLHNAVPA